MFPNLLLSKNFVFLIFLLALNSCGVQKISLDSPSVPSDIDLIVYSATPGGIMSAVSAARHGRKVLVVEPSSRVGGIISGGLGASDICNHKLIGGLSKEFFERVGARYGKSVAWRLEPRVAEEEFIRLLNQEKIPVILGTNITSVTKNGSSIASVRTSAGKSLAAKVFIDASYEGDLLAKSGVDFIVGRESKEEFNESFAGRSKLTNKNQWPANLDPFDDSGQLLPGVSTQPLISEGSADAQVMAYNFRPCFSKDPENQVPFAKPLSYDPRNYELLARYIELSSPGPKLSELLMFLKTVRNKVDINSIGPMSTDFLNMSGSWAESDWKTRKEIFNSHKRYTLGLLYFLSSSERVHQNIRDSLSRWGLCKDEFVDTGNFPHQLYVRSGRRMRGEQIMTQHDLISSRSKEDAVAWGSCRIEVHHGQRLLTEDNRVVNEGNVGFRNPPYQIPFGAIIPKKEDVSNLVVPVSLSASSIAYSSIRMEPVFMSLGHAAGIAAHLAIESDKSIQEIDRSQLQTILKAERAIIH